MRFRALDSKEEDMLASEERLIGSRGCWFNVPTFTEGMPRGDRKQDMIFESEGGIPLHEYLNVEVKEETEDDEESKKEYILLDSETDAHCSLTSQSLLVPDFIKTEDPGLQGGSREKMYSERDPNINEIPKDPDVENYEKYQSERIKQIYSLLYPKYMENLGPNQGHQPQASEALNSGPVVQQNKQGKPNGKVAKNSFVSLRFQLSPWETEQLVRKREQNRRRKALQRAQETEKQKNLRREKERLAKAALRATEPMEKRLIRREKDRIAKALSRAAESEEQRKIRREKNRVAMAALRAAQSEEERFIRREKDRIKKATMRALETEEQKRIRREKNRITMAIRRANLKDQERTYLRNVNRIAKAASRANLTPEERAALMMEAKLERDAVVNSSLDPLGLADLNEAYSNSMDCLTRLENATNFGRARYEESNSENSERSHPYPGPWEGGTPSKILLHDPSPSNLHTPMSVPSTS